jgi:hypothetical protein
MHQQRFLVILALAAAAAWPAAAEELRHDRSAWSSWHAAPSLGIRQPRLQLGVELDAVHAPASARWSAAPAAAAADLRLVGKAALGPSLAVYGSLGTLQSPIDPTALMGAGAAGAHTGLSYGAGLSWEFTERASATLGVESYELRSQGAREPVFTTRVGLKLRY